MNIRKLLEMGRSIWGKPSMSLDHIVVAMGVVYGDLCRQARAQTEGGPIDTAALEKEMGNIIFSAIRWCDDLGLDPEVCLQKAITAQEQYKQRTGQTQTRP